MATLEIEAGILDLIGGVAECYALLAPESARSPFIVYQRISGAKWRDINGPSGMAQTFFQIDIYSNDYAESLSLNTQVRKILDGYKGTVTIGLDTVRIGGVSFQNERNFVEDNVKPKLFRFSVDYLFTYEEGL
jgi:hypothetical protein